MQKIIQALFASVFFLPPLMFLVAAFLPLLGHKAPNIAFVGLVPLYSVLMWQAFQRRKKPRK